MNSHGLDLEGSDYYLYFKGKDRMMHRSEPACQKNTGRVFWFPVFYLRRSHRRQMAVCREIDGVDHS